MLIKKNRIPIKSIILYGFLPSSIKKMIYRLKGYKIGRNVVIGLGSIIEGKSVEIGDNTKIGFFTVIRAKKIKLGRFIKIGMFDFWDAEEIEIGDDSKINEQVIVGGIKNPDSIIRIGKRVIIMEYSFLNPTKPLIIGDDTGIGGHCLLFTHGSWLSQLDGFPVQFAPITIGKNVWLPWRVFIMPGVSIGDNVVIGANSLVSRNLPSNCLAAGSPAKIITDNYPPVLSDERRTLILQNIFSDFVSFTTYHGLNVSSNDINSSTKIFTIEKSKKIHEIIYCSSLEIYQSNVEDNLLIVDIPENIRNSQYPYKMIINLRTKERIGKSDVGEEFVSFISRYGIRFNRLD